MLAKRAVGAVFLLAVVLFCSDARAEPQITDQFKHVANEIAKRFVKTELEDACNKKDGSRDPLCDVMMASLADVFEMAIDRNLDEEHLAAALRRQLVKLVQVTAVELGRGEVQLLLGETTDAPPTDCSAKGIARPLATCLAARAYKGIAASQQECDAANAALAAVAKNCGVPLNVTRKDDVVARVLAVRDLLKERRESYQATMILTQLAQIVDASSGGTFYGTMRAVAASDDRLLRDVASISRHSVFLEADIDDVISKATVNVGGCAGAGAVAKRAQQWKAVRATTFAAVSRAIARYEVLPKEMADLPDDLPDPQCKVPSDALAEASATLRRRAHAFRVDVTVASTVHKGILGALLIAMLADFVTNQDSALLLQSLGDFGLDVLAHLLAARDADEVECRLAPNGLRCAPLAGGQAFSVRVPGLADDDLLTIVEERHTPQSARRTCLYQAVAALASGSFEMPNNAGGVCRLEGGDFLRGTLFEKFLTPLPGGLAKWNADQLLPSVIPGVASLRFTAGLGRQQANEMLATLLPRLKTTANNIAEVQALENAVKNLRTGLDAQAQRELLRGAADILRPRLTRVLDDHVAPLTWCTESARRTSIACAARVLVDAAYDPVMTYVSTPSSSPSDTSELARTLYVQLDALDPLGATPLLFNIGPGMTVLTRFGSDETTVHFTLLDKFGLAYRWGERNQFEVGGFAGGFIDAIIRTASEGTSSNPYWLLGGTIGWRQFSRSYPFGVEAHVASAIPFDVNEFGDRVALAAGLNFIVPADIAFGRGK